MNLTFGPAFMAVHRVCDFIIDSRAEGRKSNLALAIRSIAWDDFILFVAGKTIPLFWIPAHFVTFLLLSEYRVLAAASLSVALGAILAYAKNRKVESKP